MVFARSRQPARALPYMSPYAGHGKLLGVVVVGGERRRAVFWQAGGSRRLPELDEARKGCVVECGVKLGDASAGVRGSGLARAERELGVSGSTFGWRSVVVMVADGPGAARGKGRDQRSNLGGPVGAGKAVGCGLRGSGLGGQAAAVWGGSMCVMAVL